MKIGKLFRDRSKAPASELPHGRIHSLALHASSTATFQLNGNLFLARDVAIPACVIEQRVAAFLQKFSGDDFSDEDVVISTLDDLRHTAVDPGE